MMLMSCILAAQLCGLELTVPPSTNAEPPVYELRIYHCNPGKLEALHARFRDHTTKLFEKHGMTNVGYWVPLDADKGRDDTLVYLLSHKNRDTAKASWAAFGGDPDWRAVKAASEKDGTPLVKKVDVVFLDPTDYSPDTPTAEKASLPRVFELRTYTASPGKFADLHNRFRKHTLGLFAKHGMKNVGYWTPSDPDKGKDDTLIYLLAFPSREAAKSSWDAFIADPAWQKVFKDSQPDGVQLAGKIESLYLEPTGYSPLR
jgi:hypothetical protein